MITNDTTNMAMSALDRIRETKDFNFYLTGSRFFGNNSPNSDWDFFAVQSFSLKKWLRENGFTREGDSYLLAEEIGITGKEFLNDPTIHEVWSYNWGNNWARLVNGRPEIADCVHVQLIKPGIYMEAKLKAQESLKKISFFNKLTKMERKAVWCVMQHHFIITGAASC